MFFFFFVDLFLFFFFFFFKQKTAYEIKCDWSSDVCSSDLMAARPISDTTGAVPPPGRMAPGNANSLAVPNCMKVKAAMMRSRLRSCGAQVDHLATTFGAVKEPPVVVMVRGP